MRAWIVMVVAWLPVAGAAAPAAIPAARTKPVQGIEELSRLYEDRDYFVLRRRLAELVAGETGEILLLRAATAHAFNDLARSDALLDTVLTAQPDLSDSLRWEALRIRARNLLRRFRYREAADVFEELAAAPPPFVDRSEVDDLRNTLRLTKALADVPPQVTVARATTTLQPSARGEMPIVIDGAERRYGVDTGANLSLLIRSEAESLGLRIRPAGFAVGTATDIEVSADLAVADHVRLGAVKIRHVVFLVVPDEMFTFPDHGLVLRGLIGFPLAEALGELRYRPDGSIEVPGEVPSRPVHNLALHDLTPYIRVRYEGHDLMCMLDTGSGETMFYEPFFRRFRAAIEARCTADTVRYAGAGGVRWLPSYRLEEVALEIGGRTVTLPAAHVHTSVLTRDERSNVLDCNIGRDVLSSHGGYTINFRSMSFVMH